MLSPLSKEIRSIVVFRALMLGDMLCAIPAVRALRGFYPHAKITLAGLPWARALTEIYPAYFDDFIPFSGFPGMAEIEPKVEAFPAFITECQKRNFDLAVQLHGSGRLSNAIVLLMNAKQSCGFYAEGENCPDPSLFMRWPEEGREIRRYLALMEFLGIPLRGESLEFPLEEECVKDFFERTDAAVLKNAPYVCVHPGARLASRRWPADRFAKTADVLHAMGYTVVLTGAASETALAAEVKEKMRAPSLDLSGKTSLKELAALLDRAELLVSNDTGVSHVAAAVGAASLVLVMGSDPDRWAPLDNTRHWALYHPMECRPCMHDECPIGHPCALDITVEEVTEAAGAMLESKQKGTVPGDSPLGRKLCGR